MQQVLRVNVNEVARWIQDDKIYIFSAQQFYRYENGVYLPISNEHIKAMIKQKLGDQSTSKLINEVYVALSLDVLAEPKELNIFEPNVLNGMLDLEKMEVKEHDPSYYSTTQLNVNFNPDATCLKFLEVVHDWLDSKDKVELLQEFLGYCLTPNVTEEKILFLVGRGANGKSTLLHAIGSIFGSANTSAIPIDKLSNRFTLAGLLGKSINITSETPSKSVLCDDKIKSVVSGDLTQAERKFRDAFDFKPRAKFIVACNEIPRTEDKSNALYRRLLILRFDRTYTEEQQNKDLKSELSKEKDGIFNWMIEGLKRLRERGHFAEPKESIAERESYRRENNTLIAFVDEECELCDQGVAPKQDFYKKYKEWCEESGLRALSKPRLGKALKEQYRIGEDFHGSAENRHRVWTGIVLRGEL